MKPYILIRVYSMIDDVAAGKSIRCQPSLAPLGSWLPFALQGFLLLFPSKAPCGVAVTHYSDWDPGAFWPQGVMCLSNRGGEVCSALKGTTLLSRVVQVVLQGCQLRITTCQNKHPVNHPAFAVVQQPRSVVHR